MRYSDLIDSDVRWIEENFWYLKSLITHSDTLEFGIIVFLLPDVASSNRGEIWQNILSRNTVIFLRCDFDILVKLGSDIAAILFAMIYDISFVENVKLSVRYDVFEMIC